MKSCEINADLELAKTKHKTFLSMEIEQPVVEGSQLNSISVSKMEPQQSTLSLKQQKMNYLKQLKASKLQTIQYGAEPETDLLNSPSGLVSLPELGVMTDKAFKPSALKKRNMQESPQASPKEDHGGDSSELRKSVFTSIKPKNNQFRSKDISLTNSPIRMKKKETPALSIKPSKITSSRNYSLQMRKNNTLKTK